MTSKALIKRLETLCGKTEGLQRELSRAAAYNKPPHPASFALARAKDQLIEALREAEAHANP